MEHARYRVAVSEIADGMTPSDSSDSRLRYRLLTGPDTEAFGERVSAALAEGYVLYGSPALAFDGTTTYVAQAVVLP